MSSKQVSDDLSDIEKADQPKQKFQVDSTDGDKGRVIESISSTVRTVDDALDKAGMDRRLWKITKASATAYQTPMKLYRSDGKRRLDDEKTVVNLWRVSITAVRRVPKAVTDGIELIHKRAAKYVPKYEPVKYSRTSKAHLAVPGLFDIHFGKLAWQEETGKNCDLRITEKIFRNAGDDIINYATLVNVERWLLPVGQDFGHVDGLKNDTTKGTPVDTDGRYPKIVDTAFWSLVAFIDKLLLVAPVEIRYSAGNHDMLLAYHLTRELSAHYRDCKSVTVDYTFRHRVYVEYGKSLIGLCHGDEAKKPDLISLMPVEKPEAWARCPDRHWLTGHEHRKRKHVSLDVDSKHGVTVHTLPSLSGTDAWHYNKGFIGNQAAEVYLFSKQEGYRGHFCVHARGGK